MHAHAHAIAPMPSAAAADTRLTARAAVRTPRDRFYPAPEHFCASFSYAGQVEALLARRKGPKPLALYIEIPCFAQAPAGGALARYLTYLMRELSLQLRWLGARPSLGQCELGGAASALSAAQLDGLMGHVQDCFAMAPDCGGAYTIALDPALLDLERLTSLRAQGFNRLRLSPAALGPDLPGDAEDALSCIGAARSLGFHSISVVLQYGQPGQNLAQLSAALEQVLRHAPEHIVLSPHAPLGAARIDPAAQAACQALLEHCSERLLDGAYADLGLGHFAKAQGELATAQRHGRLHYGVLGYTARAECDLIGAGVGALSAVGKSYCQNHACVSDYYADLDAGRLPIARGLKLSEDDLFRRKIIHTLMSNFELNIAAFEQRLGQSFAHYFRAELAQLIQLEAQGLLRYEPSWLSIRPAGRTQLRRICQVFERYRGPGHGAAS